MKNLEKYKGVIPAFYAAYDKDGNIDRTRVAKLTEHLIKKGVKGLYVNGSSGECIYQSVEDRKAVIEEVVSVARGRITIINHVACNNTKDSIELAEHSEKLGVDAIAAIPPIYFKLPEYAIEKYWNAISNAAPNTDFVIYNIPQLAGVALSDNLFINMLKNNRVIGVKNSSMPVLDIEKFKMIAGDEYVIFNGPDEQYLAGRVAGADGGIGGTYAVMPELFLRLERLILEARLEEARKLQNIINGIIFRLCSGKGCMYAMIKEVLRINESLDIGGVREPFYNLVEKDYEIAEETAVIIREAIGE